MGFSGEWPTDFEGLRGMAVEATKPHLSRRILERMPRLVAHRSMSGIPGFLYTDYDIGGAKCCTAEEGMLLYLLVRALQPLRPLEIGCYVGWSTAHLLAGLNATLQIVDPFTEVSKELTQQTRTPSAALGERFSDNLMKCDLLDFQLVNAPSPQALDGIAPQAGWDFVFLDGEHNQGQPVRDVEGMLPHLMDDCTVVLHDGWHEGVQAAMARLKREGFSTRTLPTVNLLTVAHRSAYGPRLMPAWWAQFSQMARNEYQVVGAREKMGELALT